MAIVLEVEVRSVGAYLRVLAVLDQARRNGKLNCEWTARPALSSLTAISEDAISLPYAPSERRGTERRRRDDRITPVD